MNCNCLFVVVGKGPPKCPQHECTKALACVNVMKLFRYTRKCFFVIFFVFLFCFTRWLLQTCVQVHRTSEYGVREEMHIVGLTDCGCTNDKDITLHW